MPIPDTLNKEGLKNNLNLYNKYWRPFGKLLTEMEREGFRIDVKHLRKSEIQATEDRKIYEKEFLEYVHEN